MENVNDKDELIKLIQTNKEIVYKICNSYCHYKVDREDLAQEIIYQLWRSGHTFHDDFKFTTWMYRVALNVAISFTGKIKGHRHSFHLLILSLILKIVGMILKMNMNIDENNYSFLLMN